ncbi:MAG: hypothetical protein HY921_10640 [Elusimicrobia bacterium]|nr:hypothetical protein [Elusimicrobiota bacterium]
MHIYMDDRLVRREADGAALEFALARFAKCDSRRLELWAAAGRRFTVERSEDGFCVEVQESERVEGYFQLGWEAACGAARDFFFGRGLDILADYPSDEINLIVGGDKDDDCPLCRRFL